MANTKKQVQDFIIEYAVRSVLESSHCNVKHDRKIADFVEYAKWQPLKYIEDTRTVDFRSMIADYFESQKEHYFEIVRKREKLKEELRRAEEELAINEEQ